MLKKWYIYVIPCFMLLSSFNNAQAATSSVTTNFNDSTGNSIEVRCQTYTNETFNESDQFINANDVEVSTYIWNLTENVSYTNLSTSKYYNGYFYFRIAITPGNSETQIDSWTLQNTYVQEGISMYVGAVSSNWIQIGVVFDNFRPQRALNGLNTISFKGTRNVTDNSVVTTQNFTATISMQSSNLIATDTPSATGFAGVLEHMLSNAIEGSTALGQIYNVLDTIKSNDISYFTTLISQLTSSNTYLNSINTLTNNMLLELQSIDTTTTDTLTALTNYISFMQLHIPYLDNIATNTLNTYNQLVTILNYLKNRPTHTYKEQTGILYYSNGMTTKTATGNRFVIEKDDNIEYIYVKNTYSDDTYYPVVLYFDEYLDGVPNNYPTRVVYNNTLTSGSNTSYDYITIDFKYNEKYAVVNTTDASGFKAYIGDGYTYNAIMYWIERNFEMNEEESSEVAAIESEYQDKSNQSESLANSMNSVTMPTFAANDLDILGSIDTDSKINFFGLIALITHNQLITKIMLVVVIGSFVGYILYGKKG